MRWWAQAKGFTSVREAVSPGKVLGSASPSANPGLATMKPEAGARTRELTSWCRGVGGGGRGEEGARGVSWR